MKEDTNEKTLQVHGPEDLILLMCHLQNIGVANMMLTMVGPLRSY
jgi:hypothetical protein